MPGFPTMEVVTGRPTVSGNSDNLPHTPMSRRSQQNVRNRTPAKNNARVLDRGARRGGGAGKRARGGFGRQRQSYMPPERWYEPEETLTQLRIVQQSAGEGYRHVVTADDVRERLAQLPA